MVTVEITDSEIATEQEREKYIAKKLTAAGVPKDHSALHISRDEVNAKTIYVWDEKKA